MIESVDSWVLMKTIDGMCLFLRKIQLKQVNFMIFGMTHPQKLDIVGGLNLIDKYFV